MTLGYDEPHVHSITLPDGGRITDLALSPNHEQIVLAQTLPEEALWLADKEGNIVRELIASTDELFWMPAWSYDGRQIAYLRATDSYTPPGGDLPAYRHTVLDVMSIADATPHALTPATGKVLEFAWSPNGKQILISARLEDYNQDGNIDQRDPARLYLITLADQSLQPVADYTLPGLAVEKPDWSPDGNYISYIVRMTELVIMAMPQGQEIARFEIGANRTYQWSVTGSKLAYVGNSEPSLDKSYSDVFIFDVAAHTTVQLTDTAAYTHASNFHKYGIRLNDIAWSPDEKHIAFMWNWMGNDYLVIASADGSQLTRVAGPFSSYHLFAWGK